MAWVGEGSSLREVETAFAAMATAKTTAIRAALVEALLRRASPLEAKYLLKLMLGDMRIGVKQSLVEEAIAMAAEADVAAVRHAVMLEADLSRATLRAFAGTLDEARMTLFHPLGFMLASPVESPEEAVERFTAKPPKVEKKPKGKKDGVPPDHDGEADVIVGGIPPVHEPGVKAFLEDKYDGMRAQVHCGAAGQPGRSPSTRAIARILPRAFRNWWKPSPTSMRQTESSLTARFLDGIMPRESHCRSPYWDRGSGASV